MSDYGKFTEGHLKKMRPGLELFNQQKYWECHEAYEELWLEDTQDLARNVYWAIIQVAAAMYHVRNQNLLGANSLLAKAKEKFRRCEERGVETPLLFDYLDWKELKELVFAIPPEAASFEVFKPVFDFRFHSYHHYKGYL